MCVAFAFPVKLTFSQPMSSLDFTVPILPDPAGGEVNELCGAWPLPGVKPRHAEKSN